MRPSLLPRAATLPETRPELTWPLYSRYRMCTSAKTCPPPSRHRCRHPCRRRRRHPTRSLSSSVRGPTSGTEEYLMVELQCEPIASDDTVADIAIVVVIGAGAAAQVDPARVRGAPSVPGRPTEVQTVEGPGIRVLRGTACWDQYRRLFETFVCDVKVLEWPADRGIVERTVVLAGGDSRPRSGARSRPPNSHPRGSRPRRGRTPLARSKRRYQPDPGPLQERPDGDGVTVAVLMG